MGIYDYRVRDANGDLVDLDVYRGKVLLIVNTATRCGFTPQYEGLQALYDRYRDRGFEVLDFPCNQFGGQAPEDAHGLEDFRRARYGATFRQFGKIAVNGPNEDPLYTYLKLQESGMLGSDVKWNFTKFLVDRDGNVIGRFAPGTEPARLDARVQRALSPQAVPRFMPANAW